MSSITKVVFPTPPPTTNDLSSQQRTQLLRKAKKLEQIFGATPCLLDHTLEPSDPIDIIFPRRPSQRRLTKPCRESSIDSTSSTSSCESPSSPRTRFPSVSYNSNSIRSINSYHSRPSTPSPVTSFNSYESWPGRMKGPIMRLVMKKPTLETIQASPSPNSLSFPNSPLQPPNDLNSDSLFTVIPDDHTSPCNSTILNPHDVTSPNSLRKQKMDRLRRKLGQEVPLDLVFPSDTDTDSEPSTSPDLSARVSWECGILPSPIPRVKKSSGRISTARDSIAESASVHRAKRQPSTRVRSRSVPSEPMQITPTLSFIIESPDEHGMGCSEEFGQSRKLTNNMFKAEWTVSTGDAEVRLWSTRRGYKGWRPKSPPPSTTTTTTTLQAPSTPLPSTPLPSTPLPSSPPSPPVSNTEPERKKKPSSYRKPVPPIPIDCY